jgi:tRNA dimethylallyltransferase
VGYKEIFAHLRGEISLEQAAMQIKQNTRQYAKRQMTWFKKDHRIKWITAYKEIERGVKKFIAPNISLKK